MKQLTSPLAFQAILVTALGPACSFSADAPAAPFDTPIQANVAAAAPQEALTAPNADVIPVAAVVEEQPPTPAFADARALTEACPSEGAPIGMACIPGGPAVVGADDQTMAERPQREVWVSTFFLDEHEVTNSDYARCEASGVCPKKPRLPKSYGSFMGAKQPAIPISFTMARRYCTWVGKRLPTEAEWEKAARGGDAGYRYPWGDESPTCERANYKGCAPERTVRVGSFSPGAYGVYDLAGNGYEWVSDWESACYEGCEGACGEACSQRDPQGPCDGRPVCQGRNRRMLKGGSWYWPADQLRGSWRRAQKPASGLHRLSFRCATSTPVLTGLPRLHEQPRPDLGLPEPPTAEEAAIAARVRDDDDISKVPECGKAGVANLNCRDPMSYIKTNESGHPWWVPYVANLGGGYVGLGADQNYSLMAEAKTRWGWIIDYDPTVVRVHYIARAVLMSHESPQAFVNAYRLKSLSATQALVRESLQDNPDELVPTLETLERYRGQLMYHYQKSLKKRRRFPTFGWLSNPQHYRYVRTLFQQGRVQIRKGNLLTEVAMPDIAARARELGAPIRIYYSSNADDQWPLTDIYRANIEAMPFDRMSVVLRTVLGKRLGVKAKWLYLVHGGEHLQRRFRQHRNQRIADFLVERLPTSVRTLFTIGLPSTAAAVQSAKVTRR